MRTLIALFICTLFVTSASASDWATTTTTHIESNPWGTYKKIEFPKAELPRSGSACDGNLFYLLGIQSFVHGNYQYMRVGVLRVPFVNVIMMNDAIASRIDKDIVYDPDHTSQTLKHDQITDNIVEGDQPLFCLWQQDMLLARKEGSKADVYQDSQNSLALRLVILDTPPLSLMEGTFWGKDLEEFYDYSLLNTPISTVFADSKSPDAERTTFMKALFVSAYDHYKTSNGGLDDSILDLGLITAYNHKIKVTLNGNKVASKHEYYGILDTYWWDLPCKTGVWTSETSEKGNTRRLLSLPFVGPVWSSWRNTEKDYKTYWGFFPTLWLWATDKPRPQH